MNPNPMTEKPKPKKRNVWTPTEVIFFLSLIKEKKIIGLMDGKRLRINDIFKTLVGPMKDHGFIRDCTQLLIKYKNVKAEYYKAKRHNNISGNEPYDFEFFDQMNDILGDRPVSQATTNSQMGFDTSMDTIDDNQLDNIENIEIEIIEDAPDPDGAIPGCSKEQGIKVVPKSKAASAVYKTKKQKNNKANSELQDYLAKCEENRQKDADREKEIMDNFLEQQKIVLKECANFLIEGLKDIFKNKNDSDSD